MFLRQEGFFKWTRRPEDAYDGVCFGGGNAIYLFAIYLFVIYLGIRQGTAGHQLGCGALAMIATKDKVDYVAKSAHRINTCGPFHLIDPGIRHGNVRPSYSTLALIATKSTSPPSQNRQQVKMVDRPCLSTTSPHPGYDGPDSQLDRKSELQEPPPKDKTDRTNTKPGIKFSCKDLATGLFRQGRTNMAIN